MRRLFSNTKYDFVGSRYYAYALTAAFLVAGLASLLIRGVNYSIEFTGGTLVHITTTRPVTAGELRSALDQQGLTGAEVQPYGSNQEYAIRARLDPGQGEAENTEATAREVRAALDRVLPGAYTVVRNEGVGPKVGGELRQKALLAIMMSFVAVLVYLAFRFEWRFGFAAVLATAHDLLGTLMFISLMHFEVSLVVVAGVLSVLGLSLNETVIIFDRVRENERKKLKLDLPALLNLSINETLPRTVLTHGTTFATMGTVAVFAGEVIRPFAIVMFFGVFTGLLSSMFIAPVALMYIRRKWPVAGSRGVRAQVVPAGQGSGATD